jgi:hypothetical protein
MVPPASSWPRAPCAMSSSPAPNPRSLPAERRHGPGRVGPVGTFGRLQ